MNTVDNQLPFVFRASNVNKFEQHKATVDKNSKDNNRDGVDLSSTDLSYIGRDKAQLMDANSAENDLTWNLENSKNLEGLDFSNANLSLAVLRGANLKGANLCLAILNGTDLRDANLQEAILSGSILRDAILQAANLRNAYLLGTNLSNAVLSNSDLSEAHLLGANLSHTDFDGTIVNNARFGWNTGISQRMKFELQLRGAIFED